MGVELREFLVMHEPIEGVQGCKAWQQFALLLKNTLAQLVCDANLESTRFVGHYVDEVVLHKLAEPIPRFASE